MKKEEEKEEFRKLLESTGIETFVKYFDVFNASSGERSNMRIKEAFKKGGESWIINSINTKASCGKKIFVLEKEEEALNYIINDTSAAVDSKTRQKAIEYAKELSKNHIKYDYKTLTAKFKARLKTQDRSKNKDKFPIRTFVHLFSGEKFFKQWINKQVKNIIVFSVDKKHKFTEVESIYKIADGTWKFKTNEGNTFDLFTKTAEGELRPMSKGITIEEIELDHITSMREILKKNKKELPVISSFKEENFNKVKADLINELQLIEERELIQLQLMERKENAKKRDK